MPFCLATSDAIDIGFGKAITLSVNDVSFSGKEVAQCALDLSLDIAEAKLVFAGLLLAVDCQTRFLKQRLDE